MNKIKQRINAMIEHRDADEINNQGAGPSDIGLGWWLVALVLPPFGFFMGITEFAANKVGPGIALWAVSGVGVIGWMNLA